MDTNNKWIKYGIYVIAVVGIIILVGLLVGFVKRLFKGKDEEEGYPMVFNGEYYTCKPQ